MPCTLVKCLVITIDLGIPDITSPLSPCLPVVCHALLTHSHIICSTWICLVVWWKLNRQVRAVQAGDWVCLEPLSIHGIFWEHHYLQAASSGTGRQLEVESTVLKYWVVSTDCSLPVLLLVEYIRAGCSCCAVALSCPCHCARFAVACVWEICKFYPFPTPAP